MSQLLSLFADWPGLCQGPLLWQRPGELVWLCLGAPLLEEWVLRAGLQECLLRRAVARHGPAAESSWQGPVWSVVVAALLFSLLHLGRGWVTASLVLPVALLIGVVYVHTRDWFACACAHISANVLAWLACQPPVYP